jgi:hypothetical protein
MKEADTIDHSPCTLLAIKLDNINSPILVTQLLETFWKRKHGMCFTVSAIRCDFIVAAFYRPLVEVHAIMLRVTCPSVTAGTKDMNLAVVSTNNINQGVLPVVVILRADRVNQTVLSLS